MTATTPLAQQYEVVAKVDSRPDPATGEYTIGDAPSLAHLPDGGLLCAAPLITRPRGQGVLRFHRSDDGGRTWRRLPAESAFHCGRLIPQGEALYFVGAGPTRGEGIRIIRSDDMGESWSEPVELFAGGFYNAASGYVVRDGRLYWCFGSVNEAGSFNAAGSRTVVIAADFERDLTDPGAWRISDYLTYPGTPASLRRGVNDSPGAPFHDHWLEGNVVEYRGALRVCWRTRIDGYATPGVAAICDLDDDGERLDYRFAQFYPWPGAQNHFHVIRDDVSGLHWMTSNLPTRSQDRVLARELDADESFKGTPGNERRILALFCSFDALNWLPAGYVIVWPLRRQASNYAGLLIDGDDLLVVSRTARDAPNQHDNDLITFHRVEGFRGLAETFMPGE
ncbi:MAG: sialidase family protein [Armatimonadota bacterium]|jgi:hypothetical protein